MGAAVKKGVETELNYDGNSAAGRPWTSATAIVESEVPARRGGSAGTRGSSEAALGVGQGSGPPVLAAARQIPVDARENICDEGQARPE